MLNNKLFTNYTLEEDKNKDDVVFSVRCNKEEVAWLEEIKELMNIKANSKALKTAAFIGLNVLQRTFGKKLIRYLFKKEREKLSDYKTF